MTSIFLFFDYKVSAQQHFESLLFWKNAEKLRIHARLEHPVQDLLKFLKFAGLEY